MDFIKTWREVILRPSDFYRRMPKTGGYANPLIFTVICLIINTLLSELFRPSMLKLIGLHNQRPSISIFTYIILIPIITILGIFIIAFVFNVLYKAFGGTGNYEGTVRFISYASAPIVFAWIPIFGSIFGIYGLYLYIVGGMIVHNVSMKKSTILMLPFALLTMYYGLRYILSSFTH